MEHDGGNAKPTQLEGAPIFPPSRDGAKGVSLSIQGLEKLNTKPPCARRYGDQRSLSQIGRHLGLDLIGSMGKSMSRPDMNLVTNHNSDQRKANELCKTRHPRSPLDLQGACVKKTVGLPLLAVPLLLLGGWACSTPRPTGVSPDLTLAPQSETRFQCGPTTLSSVLSFYGVTLEEEEISEAIYSPTARGVLLTDLSRIAREQGFETQIRTGTLDDLSIAVTGRTPPIVLLDLGLGRYNIPHFTAVTGVADSGVFLLGPEPEADFITTPRFERQWKKAGNQYLVLLPPPAFSQ